jgi:hypothetical protein
MMPSFGIVTIILFAADIHHIRLDSRCEIITMMDNYSRVINPKGAMPMDTVL